MPAQIEPPMLEPPWMTPFGELRGGLAGCVHAPGAAGVGGERVCGARAPWQSRGRRRPLCTALDVAVAFSPRHDGWRRAEEEECLLLSVPRRLPQLGRRK